MNTQDGYDWPNPHPEPPTSYQPMAPYFREQLQEDSEAQLADVPAWPTRCTCPRIGGGFVRANCPVHTA